MIPEGERIQEKIGEVQSGQWKRAGKRINGGGEEKEKEEEEGRCVASRRH